MCTPSPDVAGGLADSILIHNNRCRDNDDVLDGEWAKCVYAP